MYVFEKVAIVKVNSKKIPSMKVIDDHVHDNKMLFELIENIIKSDNDINRQTVR